MVWAARSMVRAVSKYSLLSISPPQSQFEWHNAVELQPITEERTEPLHRRSSRPYICMRRGYLGLRSGTVRTGKASPSPIGRGIPAPVLIHNGVWHAPGPCAGRSGPVDLYG